MMIQRNLRVQKKKMICCDINTSRRNIDEDMSECIIEEGSKRDLESKDKEELGIEEVRKDNKNKELHVRLERAFLERQVREEKIEAMMKELKANKLKQ